VHVIALFKSAQEHTTGLAAFPILNKDAVVIFIYDWDVSYPFWNKGVKYPIDLGFYDENYNLIYSTSLEPEQRNLVYSPKPYRFVVESNKGQLKNFVFKKHSLIL
jgi:uncharacterized membrane protein (UPF0127 family)